VPEYRLHDRTVQVTQYDRSCIGRRTINLSKVFAGQYVGIRLPASMWGFERSLTAIWLVSIIDYGPGFYVTGKHPTKYGAGERNRTPDRLITNQLLYLLSYAS
jgi:hypothetical protein